MFFKPREKLEGDPSLHGIKYDNVTFPTPDGRKLHGWMMKAEGDVKATIIQCHGNSGNVSSQYPLLRFLVQHGYNVFCFDYGGYGLSIGTPSPDSIEEDAKTAVQFVKSKYFIKGDKLVLFGQSLGGAAASATMANDPEIRAIILEGTFTSYRDMAFETLIGRALFFLTPFCIPNRGPIYQLKKIAPRPILVIHGAADGKIPFKFGKKLYEKAGGEKSLTILQGFHHLQGNEDEPEYEKAILNFLIRVFHHLPDNP